MSIIRLPLKVSSLGRLLANCASVTVELSCYAKSLINGTSHILVRNGAPYNYYCIVMHWTHNSVNDSSRLQTTGQARARAGPGREGSASVYCVVYENQYYLTASSFYEFGGVDKCQLKKNLYSSMQYTSFQRVILICDI